MERVFVENRKAGSCSARDSSLYAAETWLIQQLIRVVPSLVILNILNITVREGDVSLIVRGPARELGIRKFLRSAPRQVINRTVALCVDDLTEEFIFHPIV